jgi:L-rhamnose isomerase
MPSTESTIQSAYTLAKERYAALGVDIEGAMQQLAKAPISLQSWQGMIWLALRTPMVNWPPGISFMDNINIYEKTKLGKSD